MTLALGAFVVVSLAELLMFVPALWRIRRYFAALLTALMSIVIGMLVAAHLSGWSLIIGLAGLYRIFNFIRIVEDRLQEVRLKQSALKTSLWLMMFQIVMFAGWWLTSNFQPSAHAWWLLAAFVNLVIAFLLAATTLRRLGRLTVKSPDKHYTDHELPSITVCVPARNETDSLDACLRSLIASDYPKLEILVIDDCSQDKTSQIIRGFAHDGVRFVKGTITPSGWLSKNWAYEQLFKEANGELLVFAGVDVRFDAGSLRALVSTMMERKKHMMCIVPRNIVPNRLAHPPILLQPFRYAWEICLPRRLFRRPPALSSCWIIERDFLKKHGSFAALSMSISPESYLARSATKDDGYSFVKSGGGVDVTSLKSWHDQWETAVRTRYPQLRRRPELVMIVTLINLLVLVAPYLLLVIWLSQRQWVLAALNGLSVLLLGWTYIQMVRLTYHKFLWHSLAALPVALLLDVVIRNFSMQQYEFSKVIWKGRNICLPVLKVIPRLPNI